MPRASEADEPCSTKISFNKGETSERFPGVMRSGVRLYVSVRVAGDGIIGYDILCSSVVTFDTKNRASFSQRRQRFNITGAETFSRFKFVNTGHLFAAL
jgi:hypothetical protein